MKVSSAGTDTITFKYDPFGRRIEKSVATTEDGLPTTYKYTYVYDNEDIILEALERTQDGVTTTAATTYVHGPGMDEPLSFTREVQTYYYHADGLGSVTAMTDSNGAVVNRYAYDTFGRIQRSEAVRNAYAFTGREYDSETGLYYLRARYYDPEAGRFVSKDPIGFAGGDANLYNYTSGNPVNWVDPWGLILWYADKDSENAMKPHMAQIMKTAKGKELLGKLHKDTKIFLIHGGAGSYGPAYQLDNDVYVDPTFHPTISTDCGNKSASTTRILAHELGHLAGASDDGPGRMNNVRAWENPVMYPIEGYNRIAY